MKTKKYQFIAIFLVLLFCLVGAVSATEDTSTNTLTATTTQSINTQTSHGDLDKNVQKETLKKDIKTNSISTTKNKETTTKTKTTNNLTNTKETKKLGDTASTNFYVSNDDGSDDNEGTQESPFKTVKKAIDSTKTGKTNNIYIKSGLYKGIGNTNLTVDGDKIINFIGDGKETTEFDGEASFDIIYPNANGDPFYWGSSEKWYYYENESGNWFMKITSGEGQITLKNLTIKHMYAIGEGPGTYHHGDSANLYPNANVDNYGKLEVDNVRFYQNYGGVGSAIRNNNKATLIINNSEFTKNQKSSSSGNNGIFYNNGTATILNSNFYENYARWGTILNDKKITLINTTLKDNIGYDGASTYKYGAGFAFNSGGADYNNGYNMPTDNEIINCTFINCDQSSVYGSAGNLKIIGSTFKDTTGIILKDSTDKNTYSIENNIFSNIIGSTIYNSLSITDPSYFVLNSEVYGNLIFNNNQITTTKGPIITTPTGIITNNNITITEPSTVISIDDHAKNTTKLIENNTITGNITIRASNAIIKNNKIISTSEYGIILSIISIYGNNIITDNYIVSSNKWGNDAVTTTTTDIIANNTPIITGDNIFCSPDVTEAGIGTAENPTTIMDAISKVNNNQTIILLPGSTNQYNILDTININTTNVKENTNTFTISGLTNNTILTTTAKTIFNILNGYNITISNLTIANTNIDNVIINNGILTFKNMNIINNKQNTLIQNNGGTINIIDSQIANNQGKTTYNAAYFIQGTSGTVNIEGNNIITGNKYQQGQFIYLTSGELNVIGNNTISNQNTKFGLGSATTVNIIGYNKFIDNQNQITAGTNINIFGENIFQNSSSNYNSVIRGYNVLINGTNIFENNQKICEYGTAEAYVLINGSNIFRNNIAEDATLIKVDNKIGSIIVQGNNLFINNTADCIIFSKDELIIDGSNLFANNTITGNSNGWLINSKLVGTSSHKHVLIKGNSFINNTANTSGLIILTVGKAENADAIISENTFINNKVQTGVIYLTTTFEITTHKLIINNNTLKDILSETETFNILNIGEKIIENNTYDNCTVGISEASLSSALDGETVIQNTEIPLNVTIVLAHPEYYDNDILDKLGYMIFVNDENKYNTTSKDTTIKELYPKETNGKLTIYVNVPSFNKETNNVIVNIQRPLDTILDITIPSENEVNKVTPITIILKDENGNLIPNTQVILSSINGNTTIDLTNGVFVYQYTPTIVGEETLTFTYLGNDTLSNSTNVKTMSVTNKDATITQLNDTLNQTQADLENNITALNKTQEALTNTSTKLNQTQEALNNKTSEAAKAQTQVNNLTQQNTQLKNDLQTTKQQAATTNNNAKKVTENAQKTIKTLKQQNKKLKNNLKTTKTKNKTLSNMVNAKIKKVTAKSKVQKSKNFTVKVALNKKVKVKYVYLIFNGKTYKKQTNKKGITKFTINAKIMKKLAGKTIKYQVIYGKSLKNKAVKIKK